MDIKNLILSSFLIFFISGCAVTQKTGKTEKEHTVKMIFPDREWQRAKPEDFGFTQKALDAIDEKMKQSKANGVLIRNGYLIAEWNYAAPSYANLKEGIQSCTKSITSMMLGLAIMDGLIPSLDAKVKDYWPDFETGPYTGEITFRHLVTMTSGMATVHWWGIKYIDPGNIEPGTEFHYHNDQPVTLARTLTYLYGKELREVLKEKALDYLQADMQWGRDGAIKSANGKLVPLNYGLGYSNWTASDLAKVGYLYLNNGKWKDKQILPESFVKESFTDIPFKINPWSTNQSEEGLAEIGYGLGWWTQRGSTFNIWYMSGYGSQFCLVLPDYGVVMTKLNDWRRIPGYQSIGLQGFLPVLMECLESKTQ